MQWRTACHFWSGSYFPCVHLKLDAGLHVHQVMSEDGMSDPTSHHLLLLNPNLPCTHVQCFPHLASLMLLGCLAEYLC
jgi:hypothetical protein